MNKIVIILLLSFSALGTIAQELDLRTPFYEQLEKSCENSFSYQKTVTDVLAGETSGETQMFDFTGDTARLKGELGFCFEQYAISPENDGLFMLSPNVLNAQTRGLIEAKLHVDQDEKSNLKLQQISLAEDGKIESVYSEYVNDHFFYTSYISIRVLFDDKGEYQSHTLEMRTEIALWGDNFHVKIEGKRG